MLENRPHRNVGTLATPTTVGALAGFLDHGLGGLDDLATGLRRTPITPVRSTIPLTSASPRRARAALTAASLISSFHPEC